MNEILVNPFATMVASCFFFAPDLTCPITCPITNIKFCNQLRGNRGRNFKSVSRYALGWFEITRQSLLPEDLTIIIIIIVLHSVILPVRIKLKI